MRRFEKNKLIKEANQRLESQFLTNKELINEQENDNQNDFNLFKKELGISDNNELNVRDVIPGGNNREIEIKNDGTYIIFDPNNDNEQEGTFKSIGIDPVKHIELKPKDAKNFLKLKNILKDLDEKKDTGNEETKVPKSFIEYFTKFVNYKNKLFTKNDRIYYEFLKNKKDIIFTIEITPTKNGEGTFKFYFFDTKKIKSDANPSYLKDGDGMVKGYGKVFTLKSNGKSITFDKNKKIDSALIELLGSIDSKYIK